jgi:FtsH-binding integral membrane protein
MADFKNGLDSFLGSPDYPEDVKKDVENVDVEMLHLVYCGIGVLIFSIYLIYDTQMMMGGNHKYSISPEEYIFAAIAIYLDIINIFLYILRIVGAAKK